MHRSTAHGTPQIADDAFVSEMAYVVGDVEIGERASLWPFVCLRGDGGQTVVGDETNVQEFSTIHCATLGDEVTVGHGAIVDDCTVEDHSLIGMGSAVMNDAVVESNCIVAANAVVPRGETIPEGHLAYGIPAETRPLSEGQRESIGWTHETYVELGRQHAAARGDR